jgi:hypothetical protein
VPLSISATSRKNASLLLSVHCIIMKLVCGARMLHVTAPRKMMIQKWAWMRIQYHLPLLVNLLDHPLVLEVFHHVLDET